MTSPGRFHITRSLAAIAVAALIGTGCQAIRVGPSSAPSPVIASVAIPTQAPTPSSAAALPTATTKPTPRPLPTMFERTTDAPTDGTCEDGHPCLGLIKPGTYHSQLFSPGFSLTMAEAGWENVAMTPGAMTLLPLDASGDQIAFFTQGKLEKTDGTLDLAVPQTVDGVTGWFTANRDLAVGPVTDVTVGGLHGKRMTLTTAPTSTAHYPADCPVQTCVPLWKAQGPTWGWDWGIGSSEKQRMDVLATKDGVVLIIVDSLDGTTYDSLVKKADTILSTVTFDKS